MAGKTVIISGATSGLGLATAEALARAGARVVMAARDPGRGEAARRRVASTARSEDIHVVLGDLSSQAAVRQIAHELDSKFDRLDVLINNAGIDVGRRQVTVDGLELTLAVNYMAPFLLTTIVVGSLKASAPARVLTYELARRLERSGVTVNAVDPGFVRGTGIGHTLPLAYQAIGIFMWPFMASVQRGAATTAWAASDPSLSDITGSYFKRGRELATGSPTRDADLAKRLWEESERLVRLPD
jgi:retinol dehydrogenase 12